LRWGRDAAILADVAVVIVALGAGMFAAWLSAIVHFAWAFAHLSGKYSRLQMLYGLRGTDEESFTPRGWQLQRRGMRSFAAFGGCGVVATTLSWLASG
jgi:hypothetical protein